MKIVSKTEAMCPKCKKVLSLGSFWNNKNTANGYCVYCKECYTEINKKYSYRYKQKQSEYQKKYYSNPINKEKGNKKSNERWRNERIRCLSHYSDGKIECGCCKENNYEFLAIDHINGGGNKHIKSIGGKLVRWLIKNNFPQGFRVLCHNCNMSLGHHGYCPHEK